jgi:hypothetical protein
MRMRLRPSIIFFMLFFLSAQSVFSHGVTGVVREGRAVIAEIRYDDGEPFSYSQAKIYSPENRKVEYQNSRTDASGIVSFVPNRSGKWMIAVSDETGHGKELEYLVSETDNQQGNNTWAMARRRKMIMSLLLIWAVTATSFYFMARKKLKRAGGSEN